MKPATVLLLARFDVSDPGELCSGFTVQLVKIDSSPESLIGYFMPSEAPAFSMASHSFV